MARLSAALRDRTVKQQPGNDVLQNTSLFASLTRIEIASDDERAVG